nr:uncharacterized protein LOC109158536 [Ipomoea batatas]
MADSLDGALSSSTFSMQRRFQSRPPLCSLQCQPPAATTTLLPSPSPVAARQSSSGEAEQRQERSPAWTAATGIDTSSSPVLCARNSSEKQALSPGVLIGSTMGSRRRCSAQLSLPAFWRPQTTVLGLTVADGGDDGSVSSFRAFSPSTFAELPGGTLFSAYGDRRHAIRVISLRKRFCFDNMWLREDRCREIVMQSWDRMRGLDIITRVECCGKDIWRWGRNYNKDYQRKIDACKRRLDGLRNRRDATGMMEYSHVEKELLFLLEQQHIFWRQRAKEYWYKGGDTNSKFFHNSLKARKRRNRIQRLKNEAGCWVEEEAEMEQVMVNYFVNLFKSDQA